LLAIPWCGAPALDEKGVDEFTLHSPISRVAAPRRVAGCGLAGSASSTRHSGGGGTNDLAPGC
jgi:hypothetical protein